VKLIADRFLSPLPFAVSFVVSRLTSSCMYDMCLTRDTVSNLCGFDAFRLAQSVVLTLSSLFRTVSLLALFSQILTILSRGRDN
jgi:hypothetical protein